jgi:WD40 repeat protein
VDRFDRRALLGGAVVVAGAYAFSTLRPTRASLTGVRVARGLGHVSSISFTRDGRYAVWSAWAGTGRTSTVVVWDLRKRSTARAFSTPGRISSLALHEPTGLLAVVGWLPDSTDSFTSILDFPVGRHVRTLETTYWIDGVWLASDARLLTSYSDRGQPEGSRLWDLSSGRALRYISRYTDDVADDGRTVLGGDTIWDLEDGRVKARYPRSASGIVWGVGLSRDGRLAVSQQGDSFLWTDGGALVRPLDRRSWMWHAVFSPDNRFLLTAGEVGRLGSSRRRLVLRDAPTGQLLAYCPGHEARVSAVAFSPDGKTALSADHAGDLLLWTLPA